MSDEEPKITNPGIVGGEIISNEASAIEQSRIQALAEIQIALDNLAPEASEKDARKNDNKEKNKQPLDKAILNFTFLDDLYQSCPSLESYLELTDKSILIEEARGRRIDTEFRINAKRGMFFNEYRSDTRYSDPQVTRQEVENWYAQSAQDGGGGMKRKLIEKIANTNVENMVKKIYKALGYKPERDNEQINEVLSSNEAVIRLGNETITHAGDTMTIIDDDLDKRKREV